MFALFCFVYVIQFELFCYYFDVVFCLVLLGLKFEFVFLFLILIFGVFCRFSTFGLYIRIGIAHITEQHQRCSGSTSSTAFNLAKRSSVHRSWDFHRRGWLGAEKCRVAVSYWCGYAWHRRHKAKPTEPTETTDENGTTRYKWGRRWIIYIFNCKFLKSPRTPWLMIYPSFINLFLTRQKNGPLVLRLFRSFMFINCKMELFS